MYAAVARSDIHGSLRIDVALTYRCVPVNGKGALIGMHVAL